MQDIRIQANGKKGKKHGKNALSFLFNGKRRSSHVAKKKKNKKSGKRHGHNPYTRHGKSNHGKRHGHNPFRDSRTGPMGDAEFIVSAGLTFFLTDLVETSFLTSFNSGALGYVADIGLGALFYFVGGSFVGKSAAKGAIAGAACKVVGRGMQDWGTSPHNANAGNVRDAQAKAANAPAQQQTVGRPFGWKLALPPGYTSNPDGSYADPRLGRVGAPVPMRPLRN